MQIQDSILLTRSIMLVSLIMDNLVSIRKMELNSGFMALLFPKVLRLGLSSRETKMFAPMLIKTEVPGVFTPSAEVCLELTYWFKTMVIWFFMMEIMLSSGLLLLSKLVEDHGLIYK